MELIRKSNLLKIT